MDRDLRAMLPHCGRTSSIPIHLRIQKVKMAESRRHPGFEQVRGECADQNRGTASMTSKPSVSGPAPPGGGVWRKSFLVVHHHKNCSGIRCPLLLFRRRTARGGRPRPASCRVGRGAGETP